MKEELGYFAKDVHDYGPFWENFLSRRREKLGWMFPLPWHRDVPCEKFNQVLFQFHSLISNSTLTEYFVF